MSRQWQGALTRGPRQTWVNAISAGIYEYLESNAAFNAVFNGRIGIFSPARSSTGTGLAGQADIGLAVLGYNDKAAGVSGVWGLYATVARAAANNGATQGIEIDVANFGATVSLYPALMSAAGQTMAAWLASGGESTATPGLVGDASCALGILSNDPAHAAQFDKGIVFGNTSLVGCDGATGAGIALALAKGHMALWYNNTNQVIAEITSTASTLTEAQRLDLGENGVLVQNRTSGATNFQVPRVANAVNWIAAYASITGASASLRAAGTDANVGVSIIGKGTASVSVQTNGGTAQLNVLHVANAVNVVNLYGSATGSGVGLQASGTDADIGINYISKGTGAQTFYGGSTDPMLALAGVEAAVNYFQITPNVATASPLIQAIGADAAINFRIAAKGTGSILLQSPVLWSTSAGFNTGAGGTVTQLTSKATGVTLNKACGEIVTHNAALGATTAVSFTLTNSSIAANDVVDCHRKSGGTANAYDLFVDSVAAGSCVIRLRNNTAGILSEAVTLGFIVTKAVVA